MQTWGDLIPFPGPSSLYCHQCMCLCLLPASSIGCFLYLFRVSLLSIKSKTIAQKNKEAKGWERREALGKRVVGENICTTGFRNRERFSSPTSSAIWKDQVFFYYHWLCSTREHFIHKVMGDEKGVPSCNFYRVYLYFNMVTLFCNSLQCLFI